MSTPYPESATYPRSYGGSGKFNGMNLGQNQFITAQALATQANLERHTEYFIARHRLYQTAG